MYPRVVFYGFYFNDISTATRFHRIRRTLIPVNRYLREYSVLYNLYRDLRTASVQQPAPVLKTAGGEMQVDVEGLRKHVERDDFAARWQATTAEIRAAKSASIEANVELILLYLPSPLEVYGDPLKTKNQVPDTVDVDRLRRTVMEYCAAQELRCFDLTEALRREAKQGKQLYFSADEHWNKEGHRVVATAIKEFLTTQGIVD